MEAHEKLEQLYLQSDDREKFLGIIFWSMHTRLEHSENFPLTKEDLIAYAENAQKNS